jgi:hypothetical protein
VHIHADIFSAGHKGVPFWRGSSRTLKTLLPKGRPFILRRVTGHVRFSRKLVGPELQLSKAETNPLGSCFGLSSPWAYGPAR